MPINVTLQRTVTYAVQAALALALSLSASIGSAADSLGKNPAPAPVAVLSIEGVIDPVLAQYVNRAYGEAEKMGAECVVLKISTPGGLETSMREIVQVILNSPLISIGYVTPKGARAASAGAFIVLACHLTAMAPGTTIGAAHPVSPQGKDIEGAMNDKITNDTAAFMRSLARQRGRDAEWAEQAVTKSLSANEQEALAKGIADVIAEDIPDLFNQLDKRTAKTKRGDQIVRLVQSQIHTIDMSWRERMLHVLAHPELAYILLTLGTLGLIFELQSPHGVTGIVGAICLTLALISLSIIPFNVGALALMALGVGLFFADIKFSTQGGLSLLGIICLLVGSLMLFSPIEPFWHVSRKIILSMVGLMACFFGTLVWLGLKAQQAKIATGREALVGAAGEAITSLNPTGQVHVQGEDWSATLVGGSRNIKKGRRIIVRAIKGLTLEVEPAENKRREDT